MTRLGLQTLLLSTWLFGVIALDLTGQVVWNDVCPDSASLGRAKVVLDSGQLASGIVANGSFTIPDVPAGLHLLSVVSHDYSFDFLRVDIADKIVQVYPYSLGTPFNPPSTVSLPYPVKLVPKEKFDFYTARQSFNLYSLLTNPMVLFAIGGLGLLAVSSFVDVKALQEAAKQMDEPTPVRPASDGQDQGKVGPTKRGGRKVRR